MPGEPADFVDGNYQLRLSTAPIHVVTGDVGLVDTDGVNDATQTFGFHRLLADFNGDKRVSIHDLVLLRNHFIAPLSGADLNNDGVVDVNDLRLAFRFLGNQV